TGTALETGTKNLTGGTSTEAVESSNHAVVGADFPALSYLATFSDSGGTVKASCEPLNVCVNNLTPGYWKNHLADSVSGHTYFDSACKSGLRNGTSCGPNGPFTKQHLSQSLGNFSVSTIVIAANVFVAMNCGNSGDQNAVGCLAGHLLAAELNFANDGGASIQAIKDATDLLKVVACSSTKNACGGANS